MAVSRKVPFTLQIVRTQRCRWSWRTNDTESRGQREADFKAPIKIELILNPNGVIPAAKFRSPKVKRGSDRSSMPRECTVKEHKIAVRGEATVGNGPVMVCSPFVNLNRRIVPEVHIRGRRRRAGGRDGTFVKLETPKPFEGNATVQLLGLPNKVTTTPIEFNKDAKELVFKVKAEADAPKA